MTKLCGTYSPQGLRKNIFQLLVKNPSDFFLVYKGDLQNLLDG
jgi:hypothetical protein